MFYYGYGVDLVETEADVKAKDVLSLVALAPKFSKEFRKKMETGGKKLEDMDVEDLLEYESDRGVPGIAGMLRQVILECEGVNLTDFEDESCATYIVFEPFYPWNPNVTNRDRKITADELDEIFSRYLGMLTDEPVEIEEQEMYVD